MALDMGHGTWGNGTRQRTEETTKWDNGIAVSLSCYTNKLISDQTFQMFSTFQQIRLIEYCRLSGQKGPDLRSGCERGGVLE